MMTIFNLIPQWYWLLNGSLVLAYFMARTMLSAPFNKSFSSAQSLRIARMIMAVTVSIFVLMPFVQSWLPHAMQAKFQLIPLLRDATITIASATSSADSPVATTNQQSSSLSPSMVMLIVLLGAVGIFMVRYTYHVLKLNRLVSKAHLWRKSGSVQLMISDVINSPCCFYLPHRHIIFVPIQLLTRRQDLQLAVKHELQHIRQGDTAWMHVTMWLQCLCCWNPIVYLWHRWFAELQEYACDEAMVLQQTVSTTDYASCLINAAKDEVYDYSMPSFALGMHLSPSTILIRRMTMLFQYEQRKPKWFRTLGAYSLTFGLAVSTAFAVTGHAGQSPLTSQEVAALITKSGLDKNMHVSARAEVIAELNDIRSNADARAKVRAGLERMPQYQGVITQIFNQAQIPADLLVLPLIESGYQPLPANINPVQAAGLWQIIPSTATRYGLVMNGKRDDRFDINLSTKAAASLLTDDHKLFNDWRLAIVAYEIGEKKTEALIKAAHSSDTWKMADAHQAPLMLKKFLARLDAELIIMHNPELVSDAG